MVWQIVRWEVMRHLRNRQFIIGLLLTPLLFVVLVALPAFTERLEEPRPVTYAVVDELQAVPYLLGALEGSTVTLQVKATAEEAAQAVRSGEAEGYFVLDKQFVSTGVLAVYVQKQRIPPEALTDAVAGLLQALRLQERQVAADVLAYVSARPVFVTSVLDEPESGPPLRALPMAIAFLVLLMYLILASGSMLLQSALQEKRDRMSEIVLSSVDPDQLMMGKIVGHFLLGVIQIAFWLTVGLPLAQFVLDLPVTDFLVLDKALLLSAFALLGYLFYAALFVGLGATMEDLQSASNSQAIVFMLPLMPFFFLPPVVENPEGVIAKVLSLFPVSMPVIASVRVGMEAMAPWEIAAAVTIMLLSTWLIAKAASRLFRTGMLMYGKSASWREIWRWLRYPD